MAVTTMPTAAATPTPAITRLTRPRVTSSTPQQASSTSASAPPRGTVAESSPVIVSSELSPVLSPVHSIQARLPATAASPAEARPSRTTGPKVRRGASAIGGQQDVGVEAGALPGVAGRTLLVDL